MTHRTVARIALAYLGVVSAQIGVWALLAPRSFFDGFPGMGMVWVGVDGPYNEHLVRDVGALNLAFLALLVWTAVRMTPDLLRVTAFAGLVWGVPHAAYHVVNADVLSGTDAALSIGGLLLFVVLAAALWVAASRPAPGVGA